MRARRRGGAVAVGGARQEEGGGARAAPRGVQGSWQPSEPTPNAGTAIPPTLNTVKKTQKPKNPNLERYFLLEGGTQDLAEELREAKSSLAAAATAAAMRAREGAQPPGKGDGSARRRGGGGE